MTTMVSKGETLTITPTHPTSPASGAACRVGQICGVATGGKDSAGKFVIQRRGVYNLSVKAVNNAGNVAVAVGDAIYYDDAETPALCKDNTNGVFFGYALAAITSGSTATIPVELR